MPKRKKINWDKITHFATYSEIRHEHGASIQVVPTMYSADRSQIYLNSLDIAVKVNDSDILQYAFEQIYETMRIEIENYDWSVHKIARYENDYMIVWHLLQNLDALPEDYRFPEYHLRKLWEKFKSRRIGEAIK